MDVQNISGPDVVNPAVQSNNPSQQNETTKPEEPSVSTVDDQQKGNSYDSYA